MTIKLGCKIREESPCKSAKLRRQVENCLDILAGNSTLGEESLGEETKLTAASQVASDSTSSTFSMSKKTGSGIRGSLNLQLKYHTSDFSVSFYRTGLLDEEWWGFCLEGIHSYCDRIKNHTPRCKDRGDVSFLLPSYYFDLVLTSNSRSWSKFSSFII